MPLFGCHIPKDWEQDMSVIRGHRSRYYAQFNGEEEILLDCVAHEREDSESIQCVVDYLMQRWRNPLTVREAHAVASRYVEDTKDHAAHWSTWISPSLLTYSNKKLAPRPPPLPTAWQTDNILFDHMEETYDLQPQSRLLDLPTEVRLQILEHAVQPSPTTTPFANPKSTRGIIVGTKSSSHPPLTKTCRQLRLEGLPIFYSTNTFIFPITTFPALHDSRLWLQNHLTDKYVPLLQNILFMGFDRVPLNHNIPHPVPHGIAMAFRRHHILQPVRIAINLRSLTMEIQTEVPKGGEWLIKWEGYMEELREALGGMEVGEWYLRTMVTEFARGVEDVERRGWNVCGGFPR